MLAGIFHEGSGLGDQLFRYITVRTLAEQKGYEWDMLNSHNFKGFSFMSLLTGNCVDKPIINANRFDEKVVRDENGVDIRSYDPEINFVEDNTIIDGSFEDDKYWRHNLDNINKWLAVEPVDVPSNLCVIGFRGGEYASDPNLFLPKAYYDKAIHSVFETFKGKLQFEVHTDDVPLAKTFFEENPNFSFIENQSISHSKHSNMGFNWRSARYAKYAIIPNSAFFILPRILKHHEDPTAVTIAPRYWARHNKKIWARPSCYYPEFTYLHGSDTNTHRPNMGI